MIKELYPPLKDFKKEEYRTMDYEGYTITYLPMEDGELLYRLADLTKQAGKRIDHYKKTNDGWIHAKNWLTSKGNDGGSWGNYEELCYLYTWIKQKKSKREFLRDEDDVYRELCTLIDKHVNEYIECGHLIREFPIKEYRIDFYFPEAKLIVEYDEQRHNETKNKTADSLRMDRILQALMEEHHVVRIKKGYEIEGYCEIINILMKDC